MFKIAVIIFRECLEIALILGILMATTKKIENSRIYIIAGVMLGVTLASLFAFFTKTLSNLLSGKGDELFDAAVILTTVIMICFTIVWMQGFSNKIKQNLENLTEDIKSGASSRFILISMVTTTILREGVEIMLYVFSIAGNEIDNIKTNDYLFGLTMGAVSGFLFGFLIYRGLLKLSGRYIFKVSSILLMFIAAGLAAEAAGLLTSYGFIELFSDELWDSSWLIDDRSGLGKISKAVVGYTAKPNGMQLIFYFSTLLFIGVLTLLQKTLCAKAKAR